MRFYLCLIISLFCFANLLKANNLDSIQELLKKETIDTSKVNLLIDLAKIEYKAKPDEAFLHSQQAIEIANKRKFSIGNARAYEIQGHIFLMKNQFDSSIIKFKRAIDFYNELAESSNSNVTAIKGVADCLFKIGNANYYQSKYDSAIYYYNSAVDKYKEIDNEESVGKMLKNSGACYQLKGDYSKALECYLQALEISEKYGSKLQTADCYNNIGVINSEQNNFDKALEYFNESLKICNESNFKDCMAYTYSNIGNLYLKKKEFAKSLESYEKTLQIYEELGDKRLIAPALTNLSNILTEIGEYDEAIKNYKKAVEIFKETNNSFGLVYTFNSMATLYDKIGDNNKSIDYSFQTIELAKATSLLQLEEVSYQSLAISYDKLNQPRKALEYYKLYTQLKDSLFNEEKHKQIAELQTKYETEKSEKQRVLAEKEKEIYKLKYSKQKVWTIGLIIGILVVVFFSIIVYVQMRKQKQSNKLLVRKNQAIVESEKSLQEQRDELERIIEVLQEQNVQQDVIEETKKYAQSKLQLDDKQELMGKIDHLMRQKKMFLQNDLTLDKLAKKINTNRTYISQVINDTCNQNFNNFLNEYRVREACSMLSDSKNQHFSIEGIAQNVGFNSIATFNRCFKKFTGVTPSFYIRNTELN